MVGEKMLPQDRAFLTDFMHFGCYNHWVTQESLFEQFNHHGYVLHKFNEERGLFEHQISKVHAAKIYAEFVAAIEDYTSFFYAITKKKNGILYEYANSRSEGRDFSAFVQTTTSKTLSNILGLPPLNKLRSNLNSDEYKSVRDMYKEIPKSLRRITKIYQPADFSGLVKTDVPTPESDSFHVILDYTPSGHKPKNRFIDVSDLSLMTKMHNKIKHRFLVVDDIVSMWESISDDDFPYAIVPYTTKWLKALMDFSSDMANDIASLCKLILLLDDRNLFDT
ncbi:hypothetical protein LLE49_20350 [Alicyclobacillus tolerans]|uniref:hypothetical protein n=1 Tax=Alicyclobacillus tolerans TaxID=90970 RepID=UPI001F4731BC|nr:hypothetical protein [Alicyclobacillus tolerans]MCF8567076.1 hypothetical protein [Alicyclobacillus tolerans]